MTALELFNEIRKSGYKNTWCGASWKLSGDCMLFQQSRGKTDWLFNFLSALRIPGRLGGRWFIFPLGAWFMFRSLRRVIKKNPVKKFAGYSQGGWFAAYSSAMTGRQAVTFGCPRVGLGAPELFANVTNYRNPLDIVTFVPPWAGRYGRTFTLQNPAQKPADMDLLEWLSGHTPEEYVQRLEGIELGG